MTMTRWSPSTTTHMAIVCFNYGNGGICGDCFGDSDNFDDPHHNIQKSSSHSFGALQHSLDGQDRNSDSQGPNRILQIVENRTRLRSNDVLLFLPGKFVGNHPAKAVMNMYVYAHIDMYI